MLKKRLEKHYTLHALKLFAAFLISLWIVVAIYGMTKPLPNGVSYSSKVYHVPPENIEFLYDVTYLNSEGKVAVRQEIFDSVVDMIRNAETYILMDFFLFNQYQGKIKQDHRKLSQEITNELVAKKTDNSDIDIVLITDPINNAYGGDINLQLEALEKAGIRVIITDLDELRDSNFLYSGIYSIAFNWIGNSVGGIFPHPFKEDGKVSLRTWLKLLNFKANHRKVILTDDGNGEFVSITTSANPHDGSSAHTNVALKVKNGIFRDIYKSESAVAAFSGSSLYALRFQKFEEPTGGAEIQYLTERKIKSSLVGELDRAGKGSIIDVMMFYLSDRDIVNALLRASNRGADIRIVLDPNKDAFGREKNGIPNRQVASELIKKSNGRIQIKWYDTHGEQNHVKMILIRKEGKLIMFIGSANLTRRNLDNFNLESYIKVEAFQKEKFATDVIEMFEMVFENNDENTYTVPYSHYQDDSKFRYLLFIFMEYLGMSTF